MVSRPSYLGGLGFGFKWDMGWMHDTLQYFSHDPIHRKFHHNTLTFRMLYGFTENFVLPLSHDEVVHGKGSLIGKMPGDEWQRFANLRLLFGYMFAQPGKKLLFMGDEFGQVREWAHDSSLEWDVLQYPVHYGLQSWVEQLNRLYRGEPALHELTIPIPKDSSGSTATTTPPARSPCCARDVAQAEHRCGVQLHTGSPARLSPGSSCGRLLAGTFEQRRQGVRRQRHGKCRRRHG